MKHIKKNKMALFIFTVCLFLIVMSCSSFLYLRYSGDDFTFSGLDMKNTGDFFRIFLTKETSRFTNAFVVFVLYKFSGIFIKITPLMYSGLLFLSFSYFFKTIISKKSIFLSMCFSSIIVFALVAIPNGEFQIYQSEY